MKKFRSLAILFFLGMILNAAAAFADGKPSPEIIAQGRELFNKKDGLGVKFACILCHKGEKAIKASDVAKAGDKLPSVINKYVTEKAKGNAIPADSDKMKALMAYIRYEHAK